MAAVAATPQPGLDGIFGGVRRAETESISGLSTGSQSEYAKPEQTIILLDWDDTLCPSNWIKKNRPILSFFKPCPADKHFQVPLKELEDEVEKVLQLAMTLGQVVIVTNAMEPWVEVSCKNFLPRLMPLVSRIPTIYARSVYESFGVDRRRGTAGYNNDQSAMPGMFAADGRDKLGMTTPLALLPQKWKEVVFEQEIRSFYSRYSEQSWKNVISIGDSFFERDALRQVVLTCCPNKHMHKICRTKTAKLLEEPAIEELTAQVRIIHDSLYLMVHHDGNLDIEIDQEDLNLETTLEDKIFDR
eukprot:TRINITY_DN6065_c0_g1_i3.p1 TRINITY_DN6065_c0_g1~~TRINITY_DN6065_c0_g1_i3.p1  ORF type:complete len:301 (+),score=48.05 TRINITY_DN6065_c0_g1_i3:343-1245(+)